MNELAVAHTAAEGTVVKGTSKGDGSADVLRSAGFRWSHNVGGGAWYLRGTRDRPARRAALDHVASDLRAVGFDVTVDIDDTASPPL